ncbi:MAG TPA: GTP cyclohydrolase II [Candidatus Binatia bacterium]|nr:GTP cyclohydrolase II [Candidatus Binatia bacterium]
MTFADPFAQSVSTPQVSSLANVARALSELRRGGAIAVSAGNEAAVAIAAELIEEPGFAWLLSAAEDAGSGAAHLLLTTERAVRLGLGATAQPSKGNSPAIERFRLLTLPSAISADVLRQLADPTAEPIDPNLLDLADGGNVPAVLCQAVIELAKAARLLPSAVVAAMPRTKLEGIVAEPFRLAAGDVIAYRRSAAAGLKRVGSAHVPLVGEIETEIIAFRPSDGGKEHLAIVIGTLDTARPVLTRLHSECFTGDLLGSLRCDCGDQLRGAIDEIAKSGSGVLLYLAQEGRGIGLVNKLRAYRLQDAGADTLEANLQLGFGADERVYQPAAEMLRQLDIAAVRLLTNNPEKVKGLAQCGVTVTERVPHIFPANDHNERYLSTKAVRFGHMF